jgi:phosphoglucosamine mutase
MIKKKDTDDIAAYMDKVRGELNALKDRGIVLIGSFPEGGPLYDPELGPLNISALGDRGVQILGRAMSAGVLKSLQGTAVIDVDKAASAYAALGIPYDKDAIRRSLLQGRLRLQGTDGVRGPVALATEGNPVLHFGRTGHITPELVEVLCYAFGAMARQAGLLQETAKVIAAEDGRDAATGGRFYAAMKSGLCAAGLTVVDLGVAPTPAVPFAQVRLGARLGVALTASHNPSSQNGVKFFIDGYKVLPEGPAGDYALSAFAYIAADEGFKVIEKGAVEDGSDIVDAFADFLVANLPAGSKEALAGLDIVFDPANGAFANVGRKVFAGLGLAVESVNNDPKGFNINQGGGVAELEGRRTITAAEAQGSPALASVAAILAHSKHAGRLVYGLIMDGDGDRGYLVAAPRGEEALVVDGDAEAFVIARWLRESKGISDAEAPLCHFVGSVESDLVAFGEARARLGLATDIAAVGDKWLVSGFREGRKLAVGEEVSGHVLWPVYAAAADGTVRAILAGNGLLTSLTALVASVRLGLSPAELARPFPEGAFVTRYTYNVNKSLFFPGSSAWNEDLRAISQTLDEDRGRSFAAWRVIEKGEEPDMLYVGLFDARDELNAAVFVRNSGTENKTGVYARGTKSMEPVLERLCLLLWKMHRRSLKDQARREYMVETAVLKALEAGPRLQSDISDGVVASLSEPIAPETLDAVLFGMRKEGLIGFDAGRIARLDVDST